jgi:osmotically-inducible protein OsmY
MKSNLAIQSSGDNSDADIKSNVLAELKYEPSVKATDIGVLVKEGTLTLNGFVDSYWEKWAAVKAAKRVIGVKAIADDIEVRLPSSYHHSDDDIAAAAASQMEWATTIPEKTVEITVREGFITLEGTVEWRFQKDAAERAVQSLVGVKGVNNLIVIKPKLAASGIKSSITSAFERSALLDSGNIEVKVSGGEVTLSGEVRNQAEREQAERIAWRAPGVLFVDNQITVNWSWFDE